MNNTKPEKNNSIVINMPEFIEINQKLDYILTILNFESSDKNIKNKLLTNIETMEILHVCKKTLQNYRNASLISFSKVGKKIYYSPSDIDKFIETNKYQRIYRQ